MLSAYIWWYKDDESVEVLHPIVVAICNNFCTDIQIDRITDDKPIFL